MPLTEVRKLERRDHPSFAESGEVLSSSRRSCALVCLTGAPQFGSLRSQKTRIHGTLSSGGEAYGVAQRAYDTDKLLADLERGIQPIQSH